MRRPGEIEDVKKKIHVRARKMQVFVRYIHMEDVKEEFLYCKALETSATAQDVMDSISNFFDIERL